MPRKESEAVLESNDSVPQQEEFGLGKPTLADVYLLFEEGFKKMDSYFDQLSRKLEELSDEKRSMDQHVTSLEQDARQPRLAMEENGPANTKTREPTESAATAEQAMRGDNFSARRVESPALPWRDDVLVENGAASPKSCLPFLEMRSPSAAGGLLPTGEAPTANTTPFNQFSFRLYSTEETDSKTNWRTRILYVSCDSSFVPAAHSYRMAIETKSGENRTFDPGGSQGRLRACPFLGS